MSERRSPTRSGIVLGGSHSDLSTSNMDSDSGNSQITFRNKRKQTDDSEHIKNELSEIRKQMTEIMSAVMSTSNIQKENINKLCQDVAAIKNQVNNISLTIDKIIIDQNILKNTVDNLETNMNNTKIRVEKLESHANKINNNLYSSSSNHNKLSCEEMFSEIHERHARSKNIIIAGIPEASMSVRDKQDNDKREVVKILKMINSNCPEPLTIYRLGKQRSGKSRNIKICLPSETAARDILRNKSNLKTDSIKIFSDQTPYQRNYFKTLQEELKTRIDNGETSIRIKYIKGIPKIIKTLETESNKKTKN